MGKRIFPSAGHFTDYVLLLFHYNWLLIDCCLSVVWYRLLFFSQLIAFHCLVHLLAIFFLNCSMLAFSITIFLSCARLFIELICVHPFCLCLVPLVHMPCHSPSAFSDDFRTIFETCVLLLIGTVLPMCSLLHCVTSSGKGTCFLVVLWKQLKNWDLCRGTFLHVWNSEPFKHNWEACDCSGVLPFSTALWFSGSLEVKWAWLSLSSKFFCNWGISALLLPLLRLIFPCPFCKTAPFLSFSPASPAAPSPHEAVSLLDLMSLGWTGRGMWGVYVEIPAQDNLKSCSF